MNDIIYYMLFRKYDKSYLYVVVKELFGRNNCNGYVKKTMSGDYEGLEIATPMIKLANLYLEV